MMRSVELFVGAGGLGIGVGLAGFEPAAVMDWDRWACDTLRENKAKGLHPITHWPIYGATSGISTSAGLREMWIW